jgi:enoyl-CoA hydratase/carnithine racemase
MAEASVSDAMEAGVARITLNRPQSLNRFTRQLLRDGITRGLQAQPGVQRTIACGNR